MIDLSAEERTGLRDRLYHAGLLAMGGLLFGIAELIAGWLVSLFGATLTLPAQTGAAVATLVFAGLVYGIAIHVEPEQERTVLGKLLERGSA